MKNSLSILLLFLASIAFAQDEGHILYEMHTKYADAFTEWEILTLDEEVEGELKMRWAFRNDITEWDFNIEDSYGTVKLIFPNGRQKWEIRVGNEVATLHQKWSGDLREWRVTDNEITVNFKTKYGNQPWEWEIKESDRYGKFKVYTQYEGDPRDWIIQDELDPDQVSLAMRMGMVFVAMVSVIPK